MLHPPRPVSSRSCRRLQQAASAKDVLTRAAMSVVRDVNAPGSQQTAMRDCMRVLENDSCIYPLATSICTVQKPRIYVITPPALYNLAVAVGQPPPAHCAKSVRDIVTFAESPKAPRWYRKSLMDSSPVTPTTLESGKIGSHQRNAWDGDFSKM